MRDASYSQEIRFSIFRLVALNDVSWSFKINGIFRHNRIAIYDFTATWFCSFFLVTLFVNYHEFGNYDTSYSDKCLLSIFCVNISSETWLRNDCIERIPWRNVVILVKECNYSRVKTIQANFFFIVFFRKQFLHLQSFLRNTL